MSRVILIIEDGMPQEVFADDPNIDLTVYDLDYYKDDTCVELARNEAEAKTKDLIYLEYGVVSPYDFEQ